MKDIKIIKEKDETYTLLIEEGVMGRRIKDLNISDICCIFGYCDLIIAKYKRRGMK
jgi:hypothetical protein